MPEPQLLSPARQEAAIAFVLASAKPLDQALCRYHFRGGD